MQRRRDLSILAAPALFAVAGRPALAQNTAPATRAKCDANNALLQTAESFGVLTRQWRNAKGSVMMQIGLPRPAMARC